ncbi:hypothetical protein HYFRA_00008145 [Hymenoscyphus fraxineus]|uniref:FAD-binding PCMH-type domain-containing protein n=1 Tax=Hymenoscyphus fraxineus TaxID=746836 RepID=A0A9N9PUM5_9HELO|nr:hypothetical protein HYFRA_00008145 [Hymenoscyphus fraxineus]
MALPTLVLSLRSDLTPQTEILTNPEDPDFKSSIERWSNEEIQTPGAIFRPATQDDVVKLVQFAHANSIPFVPASGGHSPWSTIGNPGFVIDLGLLNSISIDSDAESVTISGAVLIQELASALEQAGRCTTLGNGNTVGVIPYVLGGGTSILTAVTGYACDQILAAKIVTAKGDIVDVSAKNEADLFWAIKGAGQFFGVVLEITLKTFPFSILGSEDGSHWTGVWIYPLESAEKVCAVLEPIMRDKSHGTAGQIGVMAPPPSFQPVILVGIHFLGNQEDAPAVYQALNDLGPMMASASTPKFSEYRQAQDYACVKGDLKSFSLVGVEEFKPTNFMKVVELFKELLDTCPDAGGSMYLLEWHTGTSKPVHEDSAFSFQDVHMWMNTFSWYHQPENRGTVMDFDLRALAAMRVGQKEADYVDYPNCNRTAPVAQRFRGTERLAKLKMLKQKWDPQGVFTREFL